jgi:hypothetical protein
MSNNLLDHIKSAVANAKSYNSSQVVAPNVILWPDPEEQWLSIIDILRTEIPALLTYGKYDLEQNQGPAIWIKCMVNRALPEADWSEDEIPVIYLPGIAKSDFKNIEEASHSLQPLMEYQFTGNLWLQENGKEWTILAFMENEDQGLGLNIVRDAITKYALQKTLRTYLLEGKSYFKGQVTADFLNQKLVPDSIPNLLKWMEGGDEALKSLTQDELDGFKDIIKSQYGLELDHSLVLDFALSLGKKKDSWINVWQYFANAPHKYPKVIDYLNQATPSDLGTGMFQLPEDSWPSVNANKEKALEVGLNKLANKSAIEAHKDLIVLWEEHKMRLQWVWVEMGASPFAISLPYLLQLAELSSKTYDNSSIEGLTKYYKEEGYNIDSALRNLALSGSSKEHKEMLSNMAKLFYQPWIEKLTLRFQELAKENPNDIINLDSAKVIGDAQFLLFVDAFRYDLAIEFCTHLPNNFEVELNQSWSALPSLTATSKPSVSPIASKLSKDSSIKEFQPNFLNGDPCTSHYFRKELKVMEVKYIGSPSEIDDPKQKYWMEIGDIDTKGHQEQSEMFKRIPDLLSELKETIARITEKGISKITIVTDHGWLLLPGGLPKENLHKDLAETRWGRCAQMKKGAVSEHLQLPWTWNPNEFIAYAPGISFFKKNEEYAHGGISLHECMTPLITVKVKKEKHTSKALIEEYKWVGMRLQVSTSGTLEDGFNLDVRTKRENSNSSITIGSVKQEELDWKVMVDGDYEGKAGYLVLLDPHGIIVDHKLIEIGR